MSGAIANKDLGRMFFEAQDRMRGGPDPALCGPSYVSRIGSIPPMTMAQHEAFAKAFYAGFPDLKHSVHEVIAADDKVVVRFTLRGTHRGEFMGIPPTQRRFEAGAIVVFRVADGKIAELDGQFDQMGMMRQLGVIP